MLNIIGCFFILIDSIGYLFFPQYVIFRIFGKLALPIFTYSVSVSLKDTKNSSVYLKKILLFALISQIPYELFTDFSVNLNILFSFVLAISLIIIIDDLSILKKVIFSICIILIVNYVSFVEYGADAVLMVLAFYYFKVKENNIKMFRIFQGLILFNIVIQIISKGFFIENVLNVGYLMVFPLLDLRLSEARVNKYFFYIFYPVHLLGLYGVYYLFFDK